MLDAATIGVRIAGDQIGQSRQGTDAFGRSGQAEALAQRWVAALTARVTETQRLAESTTKLADRLRDAADGYERTENDNANRLTGLAGEVGGAGLKGGAR
jgi:predicted trehalose synthase